MPHIPEAVEFGLIVALASILGTLVANFISSRATRASAKAALTGVSQQIDFQIAAKVAEFRQAWINELRDCMAEVQSFGVTPDLDHARQREFYKFGTRIELLMNRRDPRYQKLQDCMYSFLTAETTDEKFACNAPFIAVCQDILKAEWEVLKRDLENTKRKSVGA